MKLYGALCVAVAVVMLLAPLTAVLIGNSDSKPDGTAEVSTAEGVISEVVATPENEDVISVFMSAQSNVEILSMRDYIIGAVAAEVPASYEEEAIKAQALAAVTFAEYRKNLGGDDSIGGAIVSDDSSMHQGYITTEEMKSRWGDAFDSYYGKICDAVDDVIDKVITYDGEPIMAAYHAISSGHTESAKVIWGEDVPYLQSTDSSWDADSTRYESTVIITPEELAHIIDCDVSDVYVKTKSTSPSGTVLETDICSVVMTGMQARELLGLRSPAFTVEKEDGEYIFTVMGYGHGVGMSQNGANCMAQNGSTYDEIIRHYYRGVEIENR